MQGLTLDLVLLLLLVVFFGVQQRNRAPRYFRLWFLGWVFVFLSFAAWLAVPTGHREMRVLEVLRTDLLLVGAMLFLLSFLAERERLWVLVLKGLTVAVPAVALFNAMDFVPVPTPLLMLAVAAWEGYGTYAASVLLRKDWRWVRVGIYTICGGYGVALVVYLGVTPQRDLADWMLAEVLLCAAVLYVGGSRRRNASTWIGAVGFAGWAGFYLAAGLQPFHPVWLVVVSRVWNVPKYFVAFSMILRVFEVDAEAKGELAKGFRDLYEDFRLMYERHPHPMWIYEVKTGAVLSVNQAAVVNYGYTEEEWLGMTAGALEVPEDAEVTTVNMLVPKVEDGRRTRHRYKGGKVIWVKENESKMAFQGRDARMVMARDITERLQLNRQLVHQAQHDVLTGLPNRALWEDRLKECLDRSQREGRKALLLTIDIDHFKRINDTYGHHVGDECLKEVADRLQGKIRKIDTLARTGGEEFAAIIGGLGNAADSEMIAKSLLEEFERPVRLPDCDLRVTVSIGAALYPDDATRAEALYRRSDEALYRAKGDGRNCVRFAM